jgi:hypothetical protein
MSAIDDIEFFIDEARAARGGHVLTDQFAEIMRKLYRSDEPDTIDLCDEVCAVVARKDVSLVNRMNHVSAVCDITSKCSNIIRDDFVREARSGRSSRRQSSLHRATWPHEAREGLS